MVISVRFGRSKVLMNKWMKIPITDMLVLKYAFFIYIGKR